MKIIVEKEFDVKYLLAECGVRYWEDAYIHGVPDEDGDKIPFRKGDTWSPVIDIEAGRIIAWPVGLVADIHYKVCDDGRYALLDEAHNEVTAIDGYVPKIMCPNGEGYGDYVIMKVDENGYIQNWKPSLDEF